MEGLCAFRVLVCVCVFGLDRVIRTREGFQVEIELFCLGVGALGGVWQGCVL